MRFERKKISEKNYEYCGLNNIPYVYEHPPPGGVPMGAYFFGFIRFSIPTVRIKSTDIY